MNGVVNYKVTTQVQSSKVHGSRLESDEDSYEKRKVANREPDNPSSYS